MKSIKIKPSPNAPCPCHSSQKYKKCCQPYHKGTFPKNALLLMRSRYSAYALGLCDYIIKTTHPNNDDFSDDTQNWENSIEDFCQTTQFLALTVHEFIDGNHEAFVTFDATLSHGHLIEKSRFLKIGEQWLYESGAFS